MFGYIVPLKSELRVRELTQYQAWYCGLCKALRREYGQIPRLLLSYDCSFLALLLSGIQEGFAPCGLQRCGYKPLRKAQPVAPHNESLAYAADINVLLSYYQLRDDWQDEHRVSALIGKSAIVCAARKAISRRPIVADAVQTGIARLSEYEKQWEASIDAVADAFAQLQRQVLTGFTETPSQQREALSWLGYHMGRWIYLLDAWEDRKRDQKTGAYNPFLASGADKQRASFLIYASLNEMEKAYDLLTVYNNRGLLDNILYQGCRAKSRQALEGAADESV